MTVKVQKLSILTFIPILHINGPALLSFESLSILSLEQSSNSIKKSGANTKTSVCRTREIHSP